MNAWSRIALVLVAALGTAAFVSGCGCDPSSGPILYKDGAPIVSCSQEDDCPTGSVCAVPAQIGCNAFGPAAASGTCVMPTVASASCTPAPQLACDCNGVTIKWETGCAGLPDNTAPALIAHTGACP
jgi:hypothetical protein